MIGYPGNTDDAYVLLHENRRRVDLIGEDRRAVMALLQKAIEDKFCPKLKELTYRAAADSKLIHLYSGEHLNSLLEQLPTEINSGLKEDILNKLGQHDDVAVFLFCTETQRFLFVERDGKVGCFGGAMQAEESPVSAVTRTTLRDGRFQVGPEILHILDEQPGSGREGTKFYPFLIIVRQEFTPKLASTIKQSHWIPIAEVLNHDLDPEVRATIESELTLQRIMKAPEGTDFEALADSIMS